MTAYSTPASSYYQQIVADTQSKSSSGGEGLLGGLGASIAPTVGAAGLQAASVTNQASLVPEQLQLSNAYQSTLAGYTLGKLAITRQELGVQAATTAEKQQLESTLNPLEQQEYATTATKYPQEAAEAAQTYKMKLQSEQGAIATSGAQGTTGAKSTLTTLTKQYGWKLQTITRSKTLATLGQQGTLAQQKYTTEQLANAQKNLTLLAKQNGLSQTEVVTRLQYSIAQNKLGATQTMMSLLTKLGSIWTGAETRVGTTIGLGGYASGINLFTPPTTSTTGG